MTPEELLRAPDDATGASLPHVHVDDVDGIPAFWAPVPGPITAALMFRVGRMDETLPTAGITHMVEHITCHGLHGRRYPFNAFVDSRRTVFHCRGSAEEVLEFLTTISATISRLPLNRVRDEARVLLTESAGRGFNPLDPLWTVRYGARGPGLATYPEYGLLALDEEAVLAWSRRWFTRENAVLWFTGPVPPGLAIDLPHGRRMPLPEPALVPIELPGWFTGSRGVVALSLIGPRSAALSAATRIAGRRLNDRIRHELALSYNSGVSYAPFDAESAEVFVSADGLDQNAERLRDEALSVLKTLSLQGPTPTELEEDLDGTERALREPSAASGLLDTAATEALTGGRWTPVDQMLDEMRSLTSERVASSLREILDTAVMSLPPGVEGPPGYARVADWSEHRIDGRSFAARQQNGEAKRTKRVLVVGDEGVTVGTDTSIVTVRFSECAAMLRYADGARVLIDNDAWRAPIHPWLWQHGDKAVAELDARVPAERQITMPDDAQPQGWTFPYEPAPERTSSGRARKIGFWTWAVMSLFLALSGFLAPAPAADGLQGANIPLTTDGFVDCGGSSFGLAFGSARRPAGDAVASEVAARCKIAAQEQLIGSGFGWLSVAGVVFVGVRSRRRRSAPTG